MQQIPDAPWIRETERTGYCKSGWWNQPPDPNDISKDEPDYERIEKMKELTVTYDIGVTEIIRANDDELDKEPLSKLFEREKMERRLSKQLKALGLFDDAVVSDLKVFVQDVKEPADAE